VSVTQKEKKLTGLMALFLFRSSSPISNIYAMTKTADLKQDEEYVIVSFPVEGVDEYEEESPETYDEESSQTSESYTEDYEDNFYEVELPKGMILGPGGCLFEPPILSAFESLAPLTPQQVFAQTQPYEVVFPAGPEDILGIDREKHDAVMAELACKLSSLLKVDNPVIKVRLPNGVVLRFLADAIMAILTDDYGRTDTAALREAVKNMAEEMSVRMALGMGLPAVENSKGFQPFSDPIKIDGEKNRAYCAPLKVALVQSRKGPRDPGSLCDGITQEGNPCKSRVVVHRYPNGSAVGSGCRHHDASVVSKSRAQPFLMRHYGMACKTCLAKNISTMLDVMHAAACISSQER